jgi:hypothetical protein
MCNRRRHVNMNIYFFSNREVQQSVASTVPILCDYEILRSQFRWLTDGDVESLIEENLEEEIRLLEDYLLDLGNKDIEQVLKDGEEMAKTFYFESGDVFKWITVLRAGDCLWSEFNEHGFIRLTEEGVRGGCPQIVSRCWDRLVLFIINSLYHKTVLLFFLGWKKPWFFFEKTQPIVFFVLFI